MLKILLLGTNITTGGAQKVLLDLANWLEQEGIQVSALFFYDKDGLLPEWQSQSKFHLDCLHAWAVNDKPFKRANRLLKGWLRLVRVMKEEQYDGVVTFTHDSNILGLPAAWLAKIPARWGSHHGYPNLSKIKILVHRWVINSKLSTGLVAVSEFTRDRALQEGLKPTKIRLIRNGIETEKLSNLDPGNTLKDLNIPLNARVILSVGRLVASKGHEFLVRAAPAVLASHPNVVFCIAGDGPFRRSLELMINSLKISKNFRLLGNRKDIPILLSASDLFVMPSIYEGLPISLLEAMASGVPVICTAIPAVTNIIKDGENGRLVVLQDEDELSQAIIELLDDPEKSKRLAMQAQELVRSTFSLANMGKAYQDLIKEHHPNAK